MKTKPPLSGTHEARNRPAGAPADASGRVGPPTGPAEGAGAATPTGRKHLRDSVTGNRLAPESRSLPDPGRRDGKRARRDPKGGGERARPRAPIVAAAGRQPVSRTTHVLVGAGIVLGLLLGGLVAREELRDDPDAPVVASVVKAPEKAPETSKPRAETITDGLGRITRIIGKHPADVLDAYCGAIAPHDPPVPVGIESANPERRDAKLGVFRKPYDRTHDYKIWIRRNPSTREWFAGDGMRPIVPERHPSRR